MEQAHSISERVPFELELRIWGAEGTHELTTSGTCVPHLPDGPTETLVRLINGALTEAGSQLRGPSVRVARFVLDGEDMTSLAGNQEMGPLAQALRTHGVSV
ncbi:hypothetical protein ACWECC_18865 [Streptomyces microflavus]